MTEKFSFCDYAEDREPHEVKEYPRYLSQSSLKEWEQCNHKFYLMRMAPKRIKRTKQSRPAAIGTALDLYVKAYVDVAQNPGKVPDVDMYQLINSGVDNPGIREEALRAGQALLGIYLQTAGADLQNYFPIKTEVDEVVDVEGVPVRIRPDLVFSTGMVVDLKVKGYASSPKSPTPGWVRLWRKGKLQKKSHKRCGDPLDHIHPSWATQVTIYAFGMGHEPGDALRVGIDELSMRHVRVPEDIGIETVQVCQIRTHITQEFQIKTLKRLHEAWDKIRNSNRFEASPSPNTCFKYKQLCDASEHCKKFLENQQFILKNKSRFTPSSNEVLDFIKKFNV